MSTMYTTRLDECYHETLVSAFKKRVNATPNSIALVYKNNSYTFKDVDELSTNFACYLIEKGLKKNDKIAIRVNRNELLMILPLAIMKIGGVYVPIDLEWPYEQVLQIIEIADISAVLTDVNDDLKTSVRSIHVNAKNIRFSNNYANKNNLFPEVKPTDNMCVFFTSGSTGIPKGVLHNHSSVFYMIVSDCWDNAVRENDVIMYYMNFGFLFGHRAFQSIIAGVPLHVVPQEMLQNFPVLNDYMEHNHVSITIMPTQVAFLFVNSVKNNSLRILEIGGSSVPKFNSDYNFRIISAYGSTECLSAFSQTISSNTIIGSIGKPNIYTEYILLDDKGQYNPHITIGELLVSGPGIGCGYVANPKLTSAKFVVINNKRYYRTGDIVEKQKNGDIIFLSRTDDMVKIHGLRVELGEISSKMMKYPNISQTYVCVVSDSKSQHLCAYYTCNDKKEIESVKLKHYLESRIQSYKIPDFFVYLDKFPLSTRGKICKDKLPLPFNMVSKFEHPHGEKEQIVAKLFSDILELSYVISRNDDFINLGGDSLGIMNLVGELYKRGFDVTFRLVKANTVVKDLAKLISYRKTTSIKHRESSYVITNSLLKDVLLCNTQNRINNFNIDNLFVLSSNFEICLIRKAINILIEQHMMLRSTIVNEYICIHPYKENGNFIFKEITVNNDFELQNGIRLFKQEHDVFNLGMLRVLIIHLHANSYMYVVCSHCVSDAISKRILSEDFCYIYDKLITSDKSNFALERDTYIDYTECLKKIKKSNYYFFQKDYWQTIMQKVSSSSLARHNTGIDYETKYKYCKLSILESEAKDYISSNSLFTNILTAILLTLAKIFNTTNVPINIVHHGRSIFKQSAYGKEYLSLERTIGCFPYVFPMFFNIEGLDFESRYVQNALNNVPDNGIIYNIMKMEGEALPIHPIFCFDYLGQQIPITRNDCIIKQIALPAQTIVEETTNFQSEFFIYTILSNRKIKFIARFDTKLFNEDFAMNVLSNIKKCLLIK